MRIDRPKRGKRAAKRLDLTDIKHVLRDQRQWTALGLVVTPEDGSQHWRLEPSDDGSSSVDILVECVLQPSQEPITARLAAGMFTIPALGEEVAVIVPAGRTDFMPIVVALLSSNVVPGGTDAPSPTRIVIVRDEVLVTDGAGGCEPLVKRSEFLGHGHTSAGTGAPSCPITVTPPASSATFPGTSVLKSK